MKIYKQTTTLFLAVFLFCVVGATSNAIGAEKPNVLFIAIDDLNDWTDMLKGNPQARTPQMDRLASKGITFTNAHCAAPACGPSRSAIMSGIRPCTSGNYINRMSDYCSACRFDPRVATGPKACPFTTLYWGFLDRNQQLLRRNPRMGLQYKNLDRKTASEVGDIRAAARGLEHSLTKHTYLPRS